MNWETILCLGDSITYGSRSYLGYPEYCGNELRRQTDKFWNVINYAANGYTIIDLARKMDQNFSDLKSMKPDIATVLIGTNDLKLNLSPTLFETAYDQLITKIRLIVGSNNIILIEIPFLANGVMLPYKIEMNDMITEYNRIINSLAVARGLLSLKMQYSKEYFYDGVHLNEQGSESFGNQIAGTILRLRTAP